MSVVPPRLERGVVRPGYTACLSVTYLFTSAHSIFSLVTMATVIAAVVAITGVGLLAISCYRLIPLLLGASNVSLNFSPNRLRNREILLAITVLMQKSIFRVLLRMIGFASTDTSKTSLTMSSPFLVSQSDIARYKQSIGHRQTKTTLEFIHLPLLLSATTEPAMLLLLVNRSCPINPLGAVNVRNRFELLRPDLCDFSSLEIPNRAALLAEVQGEPRHVKRGVEYDLEVNIMIPDDAGTGKAVVAFRQIFTMLEMRKTKELEGEARPSEVKVVRADSSAVGLSTSMSFSGRDPLTWAALCKDYNFIHISNLAAKLFGLPGKLAHGNHVVAKAVQSSQEDGAFKSLSPTPMWMETHFRRPVTVPTKLAIEAAQSTTTSTLTISRSGQACVMVEYGAL